MEEKKVYESPTMEVVEFELEDCIATSGTDSANFTEWIFD